MSTRLKLLKAAAILNYVFAAMWFVVTACFFALSNNLYWMFLVFALVTLYDGFIIMSVRDDMAGGQYDKKAQTKFLVAWIVSILSPVSFVLCAVAYFYNKTSDDEPAAPATKEAEQPTEQSKPKSFWRKPCFTVACVALAVIIVCGFVGACFETSGFPSRLQISRSRAK